MSPGSAFELILILALAGGTLVAALWALRRAATLMAPRRRAQYHRALPLIELGLVAAAILAVAALVLDAGPAALPLVFAAVLAVILGAGWFAVRDLISGAVLRAEDAYEPGQWIRVDGVEGRIREVGLRTLEVELEDGTRVRIPYTRMAGTPLVRAGRTEDASGHTFAIDLPPELGPVRMLPIIRAAARNCFFVSATRDPEVHVTSGSEGHSYHVTVFALDRSFLSEAEAAIRGRVDAERTGL
jgi:small-conductance mechanosensitive channel